jgi:hypothetical protein
MGFLRHWVLWCDPAPAAERERYAADFRTIQMSTRFEILKNGERVCVAGINGDGVLSVGLDYVKHPGHHCTHNLHIGGLGLFDGSQDRQHHAAWPAPGITTGDEITIRILPPGGFDEPHGMTGSPKKTLDDPALGRLNYYVDAWDADISFDSAPIKTAHIHLRADESGPTPAQRNLLHDLPARHTELWPEISAALVRCHSEIETVDELSKRIAPRVGINLYDDSTTVEISYNVHGDPDYRAYFVTLRNWQIAEVCLAE